MLILKLVVAYLLVATIGLSFFVKIPRDEEDSALLVEDDMQG